MMQGKSEASTRVNLSVQHFALTCVNPQLEMMFAAFPAEAAEESLTAFSLETKPFGSFPSHRDHQSTETW